MNDAECFFIDFSLVLPRALADQAQRELRDWFVQGCVRPLPVFASVPANEPSADE